MLRWTQRVGKVHGKDQAFRILSIARVAFIFSGRTGKTRTVHGEEVAMKGQLSDDEFKVLLPPLPVRMNRCIFSIGHYCEDCNLSGGDKGHEQKA